MAVPQASENTQNHRSHRLPVEQILPKDIQALIERVVTSAPRVDHEWVDRLDREHGLTGRFGLSRRRLHLYLNRTRKQCLAASGRTLLDQKEHEDGDKSWQRRIHRLRRRQASVAAVLDQTFGMLAASNPNLWERRAYLMLVGLVYVRLATHEDDISTDELVSLAKILAETRRANGRSRDPVTEPVTGEAPARLERLPPHFARLVRQVYGANVATSGNACEA